MDRRSFFKNTFLASALAGVGIKAAKAESVVLKEFDWSPLEPTIDDLAEAVRMLDEASVSGLESGRMFYMGAAQAKELGFEIVDDER